MEKTAKSVDEYLAALPETVRSDMETLDAKIADVMQGQPRTLWEGAMWGGTEQTIIGYGDYRYERPRKTIEWFMVGLALQKNYISVYINAVEDKQYLAEKYAGELGEVKVGKSSISFKKLEDLDLETLLRLVRIAKDQMAAA